MRIRTGILVVLALALALPSFAQGGMAQPFADVPADHWAAQAIRTLAAAGIIEGVPNGVFEGRRPVTRYELAVALARMLERIERLTPGTTTSGPTIEQIRQLILTDADVANRLRGQAGRQGEPGQPGRVPTAEEIVTAVRNNPELMRQLRGERGEAGAAGRGPTAQEIIAAFNANPTVLQQQIQQAVGLTREQSAALLKLLNEFGPEIAAIRGDIRTLTDRVAALELAVSKIPPLRVGLVSGLRSGIQADTIDLVPDAEAIATNATIYGAALGGGADASLAKDLLKGARFAVAQTDINIDGTLSNGIAGHATLRAITPVSFEGGFDPFEGYNGGSLPRDFDGLNSYSVLPGSNVLTSADTLQLWDWYAMFSTGVLGKDFSVTAGRHSTSIAQGLLVDNHRQPLLGVSADTGFGSLNFGFNVSTLDRVENPGTFDPEVNQDGYTFAYLGFNVWDWSIVGTWLQNGFGQEKGWSAAAEGKLFGIHLFGEYAQLTDDVTGVDPADGTDTGWVVGADLINNWHGFSLTGRYGEIDPGFTPVLTALYPYAAVNAYDINWIDRPLFLDPNNVTQGWEAEARLALSKSWQLSGRMYDGNHKALPGINVDADTAWYVMLKKQVSTGMAASVLYGEREVSDLTTGADIDGVDKLKVLRGAIEFTL